MQYGQAPKISLLLAILTTLLFRISTNSQHISQTALAGSSTVEIDFDDTPAPCFFRDADPLRSAYADLGVTFDGSLELDGGAILDECADYGVSGYSPPNMLAFNDNDSSNGKMSNGGVPRPPETLTFSFPVGRVELWAGTRDDPEWTGDITLTAYDSEGVIVDSDTLTLSPTFTSVSVSADLIYSVELSASARVFVVDNLSFERVLDSDSDGTLDPQDCAPTDPDRNPSAEESCNGLDDNCDQNIDESYVDTDSDGEADCVDTDDDGDGVDDRNDCSPSNPTIYPSALELCDDIDQDCDGDIVDTFEDSDGDASPDCIDPDDDNDNIEDTEDCAPFDSEIYPGAIELCDGLDQDCNGVADDSFVDTDSDGFPDCSDSDDDNDGASDEEDCAPLDDSIYPSQFEDCDGIDNNCDGVVDPEEVCPSESVTPTEEEPETTPTFAPPAGEEEGDSLIEETTAHSGCACRLTGERTVPPRPPASLPAFVWWMVFFSLWRKRSAAFRGRGCTSISEDRAFEAVP